MIYEDLLKHVYRNGEIKPQRAMLNSTRTRPSVKSIFGAQIRYDLNKGFPLVTTKRMPWKSIMHELLWFISGSTSVRPLQANGVTIWDEWADASGELGPVYGKQWRRWECVNGTVDQLANLIQGIAKVRDNPWATEGRRLILSSWNPGDMPDPKVPTGCHTLVQFNVIGGKLSSHLYQRSADMFLGVPFNIACYALLTHILANISGLGVGDYVHSFGDAHIYENHYTAVEAQLLREPYPFPHLLIRERIQDIDAIKTGMFELIGYQSHGRLPGEVAV